ncbi:uncharacterized protein RHOBADRAFT_54275 [Rhodotorula graminis WP1]|uniref:VPS9 domain-containing protein n=1 Tax=Rhodotorula graminis (strain WP1) TaxID=578459 RepID=A0A194S160_RHOGW|nr:uncharacterized protein RHOBADRAFT_54275 [Rhodotorula graminis WP1]KPV74458.1 hypothetical protein RHOBADRAFT_54275 [Rhodotorula graminis WP1]
MGPLGDSSSPSADSASADVPAPRTSVSRQSSRRSLRGSEHPLLASSSSQQQDSQGTGTSSSGPYAVYSAGKRRAAGASTGSFTSTSPSSALVSPGEGPLSPSSSSAPGSTMSSPPFAPTSAPFLPPLVSRPSNSSLPSPSGRQYARSVSEAKEQLQRQALKAELQALGLAAESAGAALVTRVASVGAEPELAGLQDLVSRGKATLLLPAEKLDSPSQLTPAFLLDHVVLLDAPSTAPTSHHLAIERGFATLSGLRGVLTGGELVFTSCGGLVLEGETVERDLAKDETLRALRGVAPLPAPPTGTTYPSNMLISAITHLSVPLARPSTPSTPSPPPTSRTTSRLAALFAKQAPTPTPTDSSDLPPVVAAPAGLLSGEASPAATDGDPAAATRKAASIDVPVLAVGKVVRRDQVVEAITRATAAHIRRAGKAVPGVEGDADVLGELAAFATSLGPPPAGAASGSSGAAAAPATTTAAAAVGAGASAPVKDSLFAAEPADVSDAYQDAMHHVRLNLSRNLGSPTASSDVDASSSSSTAADAAPSMEDFSQLEERVDAALEQLEDLATSVLHDRLFAPRDERTGASGGGSRDLQEDENLASRIAALNVLELGLDHLGIDLGDDEHGEELPGWEGRSSGPRESLEDLAALVGRQLNRLEDPHERTPSAKLAILVECHKVLVDGLSKLPPVPLKKDLDEADKASLSDHPVEVEMDDASSRSSSLPPSRAMSPPPPRHLEHKQSDDELLKTPRAPLPNEERDVPEIKLPEANELSTSVLDATSSSMFERPVVATAAPSPPVSIFETKRRPASIASTTATSSADLILPLLIYSVVRANPPHLVSHLHFVHRFRSESLLRGQSSFCATNFDAVVEFLNHVDVSSLGLSSSKLLGGTTGGGGAPTPSLGSSPSTSSLASPTTRPRAYTTPSLLRSRVSTTADQLVGSANTALTGLVGSSYHALFGPKGLSAAAPRSLEDVKSVLEGARGRARESLPFRRSATFSRLGASQSPSGTGSSARSSRAMTLALDGDEKSAPLAVSGPSATRTKGEEMVVVTPSSPSGTPSAPTTTAEAYAPPPPPRHPRSTAAEAPLKDKDDDARSIRSVSSFLNFRDSSLGRALGEVRDGVVGAAAGAAGAAGATVGVAGGPAGAAAAPAAEEPRSGSFSGRLAGLSGLHRFAGGGSAAPPTSSGPAASTSPVSSRRSSLLNPLNGVALSPWATSSSTSSSSAPAPAPASPLPALASVALQPNSRFVDVGSAADLKLGEIQLLLDEYKRLAKAVVEAQQQGGEQKPAAGAGEAGIKEEVEGDE